MRAVILVVALVSVGCGAEAGSESASDVSGEDTGSVENALGTDPRWVAVEAARRCSVISGETLIGNSVWSGSGGLTYTYAKAPGAVLSCYLDDMVNPWDTAVLRTLTYNHPESYKEPLMCMLQGMSGNTAVIGTSWMSSKPNSQSLSTAQHWYSTNFNGWVRTAHPTQNWYRLLCRLPPGIEFLRFTFSYDDAL